jgi:hypothetical protein
MSKNYKIAKPIPSGHKAWSIIESAVPGTLGGNAPAKVYGRLDCPTALRFLAKGKYAPSRVFFHTEGDAIACGFRPCFSCLPEKYRAWKASQ